MYAKSVEVREKFGATFALVVISVIAIAAVAGFTIGIDSLSGGVHSLTAAFGG